MALGTAVHCAVLEPDKFEKYYQQQLDPDEIPGLLKTHADLQNYCRKNNLGTSGVKQELIKKVITHNPDIKIWDIIAEQHNNKKSMTTLRQETYEKVLRMRDSVLNNPTARKLFSSGDPEVSVWGQHHNTGQLIKCRADWMRPDGICVDLKTCACAAPDSFSKDYVTYGYDIQQCHYIETLNSAKNPCNAFLFVAIESEPPYLCQVYDIKEKQFSICQQRYETIMSQLNECYKNDIWPGYTKPLSILSLPNWYIKSIE